MVRQTVDVDEAALLNVGANIVECVDERGAVDDRASKGELAPAIDGDRLASRG